MEMTSLYLLSIWGYHPHRYIFNCRVYTTRIPVHRWAQANPLRERLHRGMITSSQGVCIIWILPGGEKAMRVLRLRPVGNALA